MNVVISNPKLVKEIPKNPERSVSEIDGPGIWFMLKVTAKSATTKETFDKWVSDVIDVCTSLRCINCRGHASKYLEEHPPHRAFGFKYKDRELGAFRWVWEFHNTVNKRLGKPLIDFETAVSMFFTDEHSCSLTCGNPER